MGYVYKGEGVYGLRRTFVLAGAKTLVMSLCNVPDQQTQELMDDFYRRILAGQTRADALREAQLAMKEKYPDPFYWEPSSARVIRVRWRSTVRNEQRILQTSEPHKSTATVLQPG